MEGEGNHGLQSFSKTGRVVEGECTCGDVGMGPPMYGCMLHDTVTRVTEVASSGVSFPVYARRQVLQHPVLTNTSGPSPDSKDVKGLGLGKRKKCAGGSVNWTSKFKRPCVQGVSGKVLGAIGGSCSQMHSADNVFSTDGAGSAIGEKDVNAPVNTGASLANRSQPISGLSGEYFGPLLLNFGEGKVVPLSGNDDIIGKSQNVDAEYVLPDHMSLDNDRIRSYNSRKRILQFDRVDTPSGKRHAGALFQHGVGRSIDSVANSGGSLSISGDSSTHGGSVDGL